MGNSTQERVSTDYTPPARLYFEPLGAEEVLAVCEREQPDGVVVQFGGQTPLKLARAIEAGGFRILGTPYDAVDLAEDRERFGALLDRLGIRCPEWGIAESGREAAEIAHRIGYPVLVRPSYVLGGRAMRVCYRGAEVVEAFRADLRRRLRGLASPPERPPAQVSVKAAVLPFARFPGSDPVLGPEMRSTGEVMASASDLPTAFAKAERAAGRPLPTSGTAFLSVRDADKPAVVPVAAALAGLGFKLLPTDGTARTLQAAGLEGDQVVN